jgi:hypothetical protein
MPIDHAILKNELTTGAAYAAARAVGDDAAMLAQLRAPVAGFTVPAGVIPAYLVVNAIDPADWSNATAGEQDRIKTIIGAGTVDPSNVNVKNAFTKAFPAGSATRTALVALTTGTTVRGRHRRDPLGYLFRAPGHQMNEGLPVSLLAKVGFMVLGAVVLAIVEIVVFSYYWHDDEVRGQSGRK